MKIKAVLIAGDDPPASLAAVSAARLAFPSAEVAVLPGLAAARLRGGILRGELLVLLSPFAGDVEAAAQVRDSRGLLRWPVVVFGRDPTQGAAPAALPGDGSARSDAKTLADAVSLHAIARENERLRGDLRTLGRRISHDFQSPLNCVAAAGAALEGTSPGPQQQVELGKALGHSVAEMALMLERVGFVLRATADPRPKQSVVMGEIVARVLDRLGGRKKSQGATIDRTEFWPEIPCVPEWIEVVWANLISNSLDHGGAAPHVSLGWTPKMAEYHFWVRDDGPGVPAKKQGLLFDPFDRLHELNAPRGIGLSIVHRLIELQGGRCGYEAPPNGGSHFFFTLPAG